MAKQIATPDESERNVPYLKCIWCLVQCDVTHSSGCKSDDDASEEGEVVAWVSSMPHGWQQEGGSGGIVRTTFITHPTRQQCHK